MAASDCRTLFRTGMRTAEIAELVGVGQRRVQQLVSDLQAVRNAQMCDEELDEIILALRTGLGDSYGAVMMEGALRSTFPQHS